MLIMLYKMLYDYLMAIPVSSVCLTYFVLLRRSIYIIVLFLHFHKRPLSTTNCKLTSKNCVARLDQRRNCDVIS